MYAARTIGAGLPALMALTLAGCGAIGSSGSGDTSSPGRPNPALRVAFDAEGGNFAVAEDENGYEYTFRTRADANGAEFISEATIHMADQKTLTISLDEQGQPVNIRSSDNVSADLIYQGDQVQVRWTEPGGALISRLNNIDTSRAKANVAARRMAAQEKEGMGTRRRGTDRLDALTSGLANCEEIMESIIEEDVTPGSPLADQSVRELVRRIGQVASVPEITEVQRDQLREDISLDSTPANVRRIAGWTYVLFDAEDICIEALNVANELVFDENGILQSERDDGLVLPGQVGNGSNGRTINYRTNSPVLLADNPDFELWATPVFTATQLDDKGQITIERRFEAELTTETELPFPLPGGNGFSTQGTSTWLFDAALINGVLSQDGSVLEFDLVLVDLLDENAPLYGGRLRYRDQNVDSPERIYDCDHEDGEYILGGILCPGTADVGETFTVELLAGRPGGEGTDESNPTGNRNMEWLLLSGSGLIDDSNENRTTVRASDEGTMEIKLIVSDLSEDPAPAQVYTCEVEVGGSDNWEDPDPERWPSAQVFWRESFNADYEPYFAWDGLDQTGHLQGEVQNGVFKLTNPAELSLVSFRYIWVGERNLANWPVSVVVKTEPYPVGGQITSAGLLYRYDSLKKHYYAFVLTADGDVVFVKKSQSGSAVTLFEQSITLLPSARSDGFAKLAIIANDATFHLFVNDILIGTVHDADLATGYVGMIARDIGTFKFDEFVLYSPGGYQSPPPEESAPEPPGCPGEYGCYDGDPCTTDACVDGECVSTPVDCDDGDACTTDVCFNGDCVNTPTECEENGTPGGESVPPEVACESGCDYCWTGTASENQCPADWDGDGVCDCDCQFLDSDCVPGSTCGNWVIEVGEECDPPGPSCSDLCQSLPPQPGGAWHVFVHTPTGELCDTVQFATTQAVVLDDGSRFMFIKGEDEIVEDLTMSSDLEIMSGGQVFGFVMFAVDHDGRNILFALGLNGTILNGNLSASGMPPGNRTVGDPLCDACYHVDAPPEGQCP